MATPKQRTVKRIVPAKLAYPKAKGRQTKTAKAATDAGCQCCPTPSQTGFLVCTSNGVALIVPPAAGGPWMPAYNPATGNFVFVNGAGL